MLILVTFLLVVGVPLFLNWLLLFRRFRSGWFLLAWILFTVMFVITDAFVTPWNLWSYWSLLTIVALTGLSVFIALFKFRKVHWKRPSSLLMIATVLMFGGAAYFAIFNLSVLAAMKKPSESVDLNFPLSQGIFSVLQGGASKPLQMDHANKAEQIYALDLTLINENGISYGRFLNLHTKNELMMGMPVSSPCSGNVVETRQSVADTLERDMDDPLGNIVRIACQDVVVTLAHLQNGSVTVQSGQAVQTGVMIGRIGLSGDSDEAHLHIHAVRPGTDGADGKAVPLTFNGEFLWKGRVVRR